MPITVAYDAFDTAHAAGLRTGGAASIVDGAARITPAENDRWGEVFLKNKVHLTNGGAFSTHFAFRISSGGADGFCFVVRPGEGSPNPGGGGLGYQDTPGTSFAVEFDTYQNDSDPSANHVAVDYNGAVMTSHDPGLSETPAFQLNTGELRYAWIDYSGAPSYNLRVAVSDTPVRPAANNVADNGGWMPVLPLGQSEGDVWVGFTGATGGLNQAHDIVSWYFDDEYRNPAPYVGAGDTMTTAVLSGSSTPALVGVDATSAVTFEAKAADGSPVSGETITVSAVDGGAVSETFPVTGADGRATVVFTAPPGPRRAYTVQGTTPGALRSEVTIPVGYAVPVVDVGAGSTAAYIGFEAQVAPNAVITDPYSTPIVGARVRILDPEYGKEALMAWGPFGASASETDTVLTVDESASISTYVDVLRYVYYRGTPTATTRSIEFSVFDGLNWSVPVVKTLTLSPPPPLPTRVTGTVRASTDAVWAQGIDADEHTRGSKEGYSSANGRYSVFYTGNGLVPADTNGSGEAGQDWYVKDLETGLVRLVSVGWDGAQSNSRRAYDTQGAAVSDDGRYVAFADFSSNLVQGGLQQTSVPGLAAAVAAAPDTNNVTDVFYRDMLLGTTARISVDENGAEGRFGSRSPVMSDDGRFVAFRTGSALVAADTNGRPDIYVRDMVQGTIERVSVATDGTQGTGYCDDPAISGDGRYVVFQSGSSELVAGDTNERDDVFIRDRATGVTSLVSSGLAGAQSNGYSYEPSVSDDGRHVAYRSGADNLVAGDTNDEYDIFVRDRQTGVTQCASLDHLGAFSVGGWAPDISGDGRYVAFVSGDGGSGPKATKRRAEGRLLPGDLNGDDDVFVRDLQKGVTTVVSVCRPNGLCDDDSWAPSISRNGLKVVYTSDASNIVVGDTNNKTDVFGATLATPELPTTGVVSYRPWSRWTVRRNGRTLVYGYLNSAHKVGTKVVTLTCQRLENGVWVTRRTASMKATRRISARRMRWSGYVRLPLSGRWRIIAVHSHDGYQDDVSAPRYLRVR